MENNWVSPAIVVNLHHAIETLPRCAKTVLSSCLGEPVTSVRGKRRLCHSRDARIQSKVHDSLIPSLSPPTVFHLIQKRIVKHALNFAATISAHWSGSAFSKH